jgi:hypothetical protein
MRVSVQAVIIMSGSGLLLLSTVVLVRRRLLSVRYGLGWISVALLGFAGAPVLQVASEQVRSLGFTPTGFSLGILIAFLALICLQLSISLSGMNRAVQDMAEHAARTELRLRRLERETHQSADIESARDPRA